MPWHFVLLFRDSRSRYLNERPTRETMNLILKALGVEPQ